MAHQFILAQEVSETVRGVDGCTQLSNGQMFRRDHRPRQVADQRGYIGRRPVSQSFQRRSSHARSRLVNTFDSQVAVIHE